MNARQLGPEDRLIREYAKRLQTIYEDRTAGDYTFTGLLGEFLDEVGKSRKTRVQHDENLSKVASMRGVYVDAASLEVNDVVALDAGRFMVRDIVDDEDSRTIRLAAGRTDEGFNIRTNKGFQIKLLYREGGMPDGTPTQEASREEERGEEGGGNEGEGRQVPGAK